MIDVSIIVLTYNQEDTVKRTLDSIVNQNTKYTYEIIINDDDSKDNTRKVCEKFCETHGNVTKMVEYHPNYGVVKNYWDTLRRCSGKYLMQCAGDDWWHNTNKIEIQVSYMENHPDVVLHYGGFLTYYPATNVKQYFAPYHISGDVFETLLWRNFICAPTVCIKHSAMDNIHFERFVDEGFMIEDHPIYLGLSKEGVFAYSDEALVTYSAQYGSINNCVSFNKKRVYLDNERVYKFFFVQERGESEKYSQIIDNSYYYMLAKYAVRFGERKIARDAYKKIKPKNTKVFFKMLLCSCGITFRYLNKRFNANLK